ncbi:cytochrome c [Pseudomaricurvus hydrocarbonicus]
MVLAVVASCLYVFKAPAALTPNDLAHYNATVEKGRYLATVGNCATCHTSNDGEPYAGGVEFKTPFGRLFSTNITMDKETGIGAWSFKDFYNAFKQGIRPDGTHLYPAFPYTAFAKLTDEDIASLYVYLQTIAPVNAPVPANDLQFPYNQRALMTFWKGLFHDEAAYSWNAENSAAWNRGAYLVKGLGHCDACHTPRNLLGAEQSDLALTGGVYLDKVKTGDYQQWSAVNLTPAKTGLGAWTSDDIVTYLKTGLNDKAVLHGPMNEVVMNSTSHLTQDDAEAIAIYLKGIPANSQPSGPPPSPETLAAGETMYTVHCGACHLPTGLGDDILGISLVESAIIQAPDPSSLLNVILYGPHLPPPPFIADRTRMKMFGKRLSDQDIASIASYLRVNFGNQASAVTADQVRSQR